MAKLSELKDKIGTIKEGTYNVKVLSLAKADLNVFADQPIILKVLFTDLKRPQNIFLNTKKECADDLSIYERTIVDIVSQLEPTEDLDTDDVESIDDFLDGQVVECYVIHTLADNGQTYANYYFSKNSRRVKAFLEMH